MFSFIFENKTNSKIWQGQWQNEINTKMKWVAEMTKAEVLPKLDKEESTRKPHLELYLGSIKDCKKLRLKKYKS